MYAIETKNLTKKYKDKTAVNSLNLTVNKASFTPCSAWFSNIWFDTALVGGWFESIANALPFAHAVNASRYAVSGEYAEIMPELLWVIDYAVVLLALAISAFTIKMKRNK